MPRVAYVNGRYVRHDAATVHVEDRGYQFADGVYEVCEIHEGRLIDERRHMQRLARSLAELRISPPVTGAALGVVVREVVRRNRIRYGIAYVQVTRGVAPRHHAFPTKAIPSALVVTGRSFSHNAGRDARQGVSVITVPDIRWGRADVKTIGLLPNVLAKQTAVEAGAAEAWFVDETGHVTEGASTNAWILSIAGVLVTHPADHRVLRGITRGVVFDLAERMGLMVEERRFTVAEAKAAREAFLTSATQHITPIVSIDGVPVGGGEPGALTMRLRASFRDAAEAAGSWSRHGTAVSLDQNSDVTKRRTPGKLG